MSAPVDTAAAAAAPTEVTAAADASTKVGTQADMTKYGTHEATCDGCSIRPIVGFRYKVRHSAGRSGAFDTMK